MTTYTYNIEVTFLTFEPAYINHGWPVPPLITGTFETTDHGQLLNIHLVYQGLTTFNTFSQVDPLQEFMLLRSDDAQFNLGFHVATFGDFATQDNYLAGLQNSFPHGGILTSPSNIGLGVLATDITGTITCAAACPPVGSPVPGPEVGTGLLPAILLLVVALFARCQPPRHPTHTLNPE